MPERPMTFPERRRPTAERDHDACLNLDTGARIGQVVEGGGSPDEARILCFTPSGRVYLAVSRNALELLDVFEPERRWAFRGLDIDLYSAGCAWRDP